LLTSPNISVFLTTVIAFQAKYVQRNDMTKKGHREFWVEKWKFWSLKKVIWKKIARKFLGVLPSSGPSLRLCVHGYV